MFAYIDELEQVQQIAADQATEAFFLSGTYDGFEGIRPQYSELTYLQGYRQGMKRSEIINSTIITLQEEQELPLVCGQCSFLNNGICVLKGITRNANGYACNQVVIDCPF